VPITICVISSLSSPVLAGVFPVLINGVAVLAGGVSVCFGVGSGDGSGDCVGSGEGSGVAGGGGIVFVSLMLVNDTRMIVDCDSGATENENVNKWKK